MEPKVMLLDEPSAGLNREEREDLARHILRIATRTAPFAMIWVEHDMQMVADLADRICVLESGTPIASGTPNEVLNDPRVVRGVTWGARAAAERAADRSCHRFSDRGELTVRKQTGHGRCAIAWPTLASHSLASIT